MGFFNTSVFVLLCLSSQISTVMNKLAATLALGLAGAEDLAATTTVYTLEQVARTGDCGEMDIPSTAVKDLLNADKNMKVGHCRDAGFSVADGTVHGSDVTVRKFKKAVAAAADAKEWEAWKQEYGRVYNGIEDDEYRHSVFTANMHRAAELQQANPLATFGSDEFSDMTPETFEHLYLGYVKSYEDAWIPEVTVNSTAQLPSAKDWTGIATTPVKHQHCGSCWAFSATEQIESDFMIQKGKHLVLSTQEFVDCNADHSWRGKCHGGSPLTAYKVAKSLGGVELLTAYPQTGKEGTKCDFKKHKAAVTIKGYQLVSKRDEKGMKQHVGTTGPLSVCLDAAWKGYKHGIMTNCPHNKGTDHCVQIVGYGSEHGKEYWKLRNSWGPNWGEKGHIRVEYGTNQCDLNCMPSSTTAGEILYSDDAVVV